MARRALRRLTLGLVGLVVFWMPTTATAEGEGFAPLKELPEPPPLELRDLGGRLWRLDELKGSVVLVNFWATWCPPCRREMPSLVRLAAALKDVDFVVLAVNVGESQEVVSDFIDQFAPQAPFPFLLDEASTTVGVWPMKGLPTTFVVDRQGRIALRAAGGRELDHPAVERTIRGMAGPAP
jgi:thiol-disulfide isomerase/thioredoxin